MIVDNLDTESKERPFYLFYCITSNPRAPPTLLGHVTVLATKIERVTQSVQVYVEDHQKGRILLNEQEREETHESCLSPTRVSSVVQFSGPIVRLGGRVRFIDNLLTYLDLRMKKDSESKG